MEVVGWSGGISEIMKIDGDTDEEEIKQLFQCRFCSKELSTRQSRHRHEQSLVCKKVEPIKGSRIIDVEAFWNSLTNHMRCRTVAK